MAEQTRNKLESVIDETVFDRICQETFATHADFHLHMIGSPKHIVCIFCSQQFKTQGAKRTHHEQMHATPQNLKCPGCGTKFVRAGSFIAHLEMRQCPVIHKEDFELARQKLLLRNKRAAKGSSKLPDHAPPLRTVDDPTEAQVARQIRDDVSDAASEITFDGEDLLSFTSPKKRPDWGSTKVDDACIVDSVSAASENMTALSLQSSDSTTTSFQLPPPTFRLPVTRSTDVGKKLAPLEVNQVAGHPLTAQGLQCLENIEEGLCAPITPIPIESLKQEPAIDVYVAHDPDNPTFRWIDYYNPIVKKYRCPWMGCKKMCAERGSMAIHLRSPAHMDLKKRCPSCLRQYATATALVQHAESQARNCNIRDTQEYRQALQQVTAGFVDVSGRHKDATIKYTAKPRVDLAPVGRWAQEPVADTEEIERKYDDDQW